MDFIPVANPTIGEEEAKAVYETVSNFLTKEIHALQLKTKIK